MWNYGATENMLWEGVGNTTVGHPPVLLAPGAAKITVSLDGVYTPQDTLHRGDRNIDAIILTSTQKSLTAVLESTCYNVPPESSVLIYKPKITDTTGLHHTKGAICWMFIVAFCLGLWCFDHGRRPGNLTDLEKRVRNDTSQLPSFDGLLSQHGEVFARFMNTGIRDLTLIIPQTTNQSPDDYQQPLRFPVVSPADRYRVLIRPPSLAKSVVSCHMKLCPVRRGL